MFKNILKITGIILFVALFFSCEDDSGMSVEDRISAFEDSLNAGEYSTINEHFHPEMDSYDTYNDSSVLDSSPIGSANQPFDFSVPSVTDSGGDKIASGTFTSAGFTSGTSYVATMREDEGDWKILKLVINGSTIAEGISR